MKKEDTKRHVDELINIVGQVLTTKRLGDFGSYVSSKQFNEFRSASLSFLRNTFGTEDPFYVKLNKHAKEASPYGTE
jgi:hypothetical protein